MPFSIGSSQCLNWPKRTGESAAEMFEILPRDWNLNPIFTQKWASVDMNWGGGSTPRQFQPWPHIIAAFRRSAYRKVIDAADHCRTSDHCSLRPILNRDMRWDREWSAVRYLHYYSDLRSSKSNIMLICGNLRFLGRPFDNTDDRYTLLNVREY